MTLAAWPGEGAAFLAGIDGILPVMLRSTIDDHPPISIPLAAMPARRSSGDLQPLWDEKYSAQEVRGSKLFQVQIFR